MPSTSQSNTTNPPSLFLSIGNKQTIIKDDELKEHLSSFFQTIASNKQKVLFIPPDYTRYHSQAGKITRILYELYQEEDKSNNKTTDITILPALGTHAPMTSNQICTMFGEELGNKVPSPFRIHDWRKDVVTIGHVPSSMVSSATNNYINTRWPAQLNKLVWEEDHDIILSIGQVVPHEVMGMANYNKNLFVGTGGVDAINLSHFIGAVHGMERMMGKADNPLRSILNYATEHYLQKLNLWYILTVIGTDQHGKTVVKGLFIGNDIQCYLNACELSLQVNFTMLDEPLQKVIVHLDKDEFHSTWLGNKAIYRTRMALADNGELIIIAPGVKSFGEDEQIDKLIREFGYKGTPTIMKQMEENEQLKENLSAVAHIIHGSSEGRFNITYCPGYLTKDEIEGVGYRYVDLEEMSGWYNVNKMKDGLNTMDDGEVVYYISNPALGLWAVKSRFQ